MDAVTAQLEQQYPDANKNERARITPLRDRVSGGARKVVSILFGAVGFILLIACVNVANLSLARAAERDREFAIRIAVGAGRGCIVRQLLAESVLLGIEAGAAGTLLAALGVRALVAFVPAEAAAQGVSVDLTVLLFTLALSTLTGVLFGLVPAITSSRPDLNVSLKEGRRGSFAGLGRNTLRRALVAAEVALALVLLVGAGLMIRSARRVLAVDPGFHPERVLTCRIALNEQKVLRAAGVDLKNLDVEKLVRYLDPWQHRLLERVEQVPGVQYAASAFPLDVTGDSASMPFIPEGQPAEGKLPEAYYHVISPDYFRAMGIRLRKGRSFTDRDSLTAPRVAVVGETLARQVWPGEDPLGKRFRFRYFSDGVFTVVGVVADTKQFGLEGPTLPQMYMSWVQWPQSLSIIARTYGDPLSVADEIRRAAAEWDPDMPVYDIRTLEDRIAGMLEHRSRTTGLLIAFGGLALLLMVVGVYSVLACLVASRTHELGIRMALGAGKGALLAAVIGQGLAVVGLGVASGLALSAILTRFLRSLLFGVEPLDPATLAISACVLLASALLASYLPARRAATVDPIVALRHE
jgi:putative ABC transport system permease protein